MVCWQWKDKKLWTRCRTQCLKCGALARNLQRNLNVEFQDANMNCYVNPICMHTYISVRLCSCMCVREVVRVCMLFPVCLYLREESPSKSQRLSPSDLSHRWMVEVWDWGLVEEGSKRRREWMMEGRREGGPCKTIPLTLGHSQTQEMLDLTPWEMSTAATSVKGVIEHN